MKRVVLFVVFLVCILTGYAFAEATNQLPETSNKKGVKLVIQATTSASLNSQEQGEDGKWYWGPPAERFQFSEDMGKQDAIKAIVGEKTLSCPLRAQDVAYIIKNGKRTRRLAVSWYGGCPFQISAPLVADPDLAMRTENTIEIEDAKADVLFVSARSERPIIFVDGRIFAGSEMFQNIVWRFTKPGIRFRVMDETYKVDKAGGTVKFTAKGVEIDGVKKMK